MERSWNPQRRTGFDPGNDDEKNNIEELKADFNPLTKFVKEVVVGKVEKTEKVEKPEESQKVQKVEG